MPGSSSLFWPRVLVAVLLAAAWVSVGGSLAGVATATPSAGPPAAVAGPAGPRASAAEPAAVEPAAATKLAVRHYSVRAGDCLSVIAARYRYPGGWPALYAHNRGTVGEDPDLIHPGQILRLLLGQPAPSPSPTPRRAAVVVPKAPAGVAAQPAAPVARSGGPQAAPGLVQPAPSSWQAALAWVAAALGILFAFGLVLAAVAGDPRRDRRRRLPAAPTPPVPDPNPTPQPPPMSHGLALPGPTPASGQDPVSFSMVVVADGHGGAGLVAPLAQLTALALEDRRLQLVVVVGQDDPVARAVAEAAHRRLPDRVTVVSDGHRPLSLTAAIDRALAGCQGEVTGVLAAGPIHPRLLDRVAGHVRHDGATMVWAGTQSAACRWSTSKPPGRFRLRLVPLAGQHLFVRTELLHPQTSQDGEPAAGPSQPGNAIHGLAAEARRRRATIQLHTTSGPPASPDNQGPGADQPRQTGAM